MKLIIEMTEHFFPQVIALANQVHGDNYLNINQLTELQERGVKQGVNASFIALSDTVVVGYRLSFAAEQWSLDQWCSVELWPVGAEKMAYFKSVAVAPELQGQGIGSALLRASIAALSKQGAIAGLAHIWRESPGNSAQRYFKKAGAKLIAVHQDRWLPLSQNGGYICPLCGNRCHCSAAEMVLTFNGKP
tara:strand:- start:8524 stop:9093 length:570 start_codon:yes stop_codon:yes gene_type:complete